MVLFSQKTFSIAVYNLQLPWELAYRSGILALIIPSKAKQMGGEDKESESS